MRPLKKEKKEEKRRKGSTFVEFHGSRRISRLKLRLFFKKTAEKGKTKEEVVLVGIDNYERKERQDKKEKEKKERRKKEG